MSGSLPVCNAVVADKFPPNTHGRTASMARISALQAFVPVVGPAIGTVLALFSPIGERGPFIAGGLLASIAACWAFVVMPNAAALRTINSLNMKKAEAAGDFAEISGGKKMDKAARDQYMQKMEVMTKKRWITLALIGSLSFLTGMQLVMFNVVGVLYCRETMGWGLPELAPVMGAFAFTAIFWAAGVFPKLSKKMGVERFGFTFCWGVPLMPFFFSLIQKDGPYNGFVFAGILCFSMVTPGPAMDVVFANNVPPSKMGAAASISGAIGMLGRVVGPTLWAFLYQHVSIRAPFYVMSAIGLYICVVWGIIFSLASKPAEPTKTDLI